MSMSMKTKICILALGMLVCLLATTMLVSASEDDWNDDDCFDCEENQRDTTVFQKLYCKVLDIRESDRYNKVTLKVETRTNPRSDPGYVTFYNTSVSDMRNLDEWKQNDMIIGYWVNIYYSVNETGVCHILLVEKADVSSEDIAVPWHLLLIGFIGAITVSLMIGIMHWLCID